MTNSNKNRTATEALKLQRTPASKITKILDLSESDLIAMQQAMRKSPEMLFSAVEKALQAYGEKVNTLETSSSPEAQHDAVGMSLELLNTLSDISETCRDKMGDLYKAKVQDVLHNNEKMAHLKQLFQEIQQTDALQQVHVDLNNAIYSALQKVNREQENYIQRLNDSLKGSEHLQTAQHDFAQLTDRAHSSKSDNAMFDPLRVIGHLLALLMYMEFIVPFDEEFYPIAFAAQQENTDTYRDFLKKAYPSASGSDVIPNAGPVAPAALPPGLKF